MSPVNIPPEGKGQIHLTAQCFVMGTWRECFVIEADAETQTMHARITGTLFNAVVPFSLVQNVALKYSNGEVLQSFGAPRLSNPASLEYIPYMSVQS